MKYYYLDSEKKVQGPVSVAELIVLRDGGQISNETKAAAPGDSGWKSLSEVLNQVSPDCSTWNNNECPHLRCRECIHADASDSKCSVRGGAAPEKGRGLWSAFIDCIRKSFDYKGRATRTEFWGFSLFCYLFSFVFEYVPAYFLIPDATSSLFQTQIEQAVEANEFVRLSHAIDAYCSEPMVILATGLYWLYVILMTFPFLAVSVRRLHDVGRSAAAVVCACVSHLLFLLSIVWLIASAFFTFEFTGNVSGVPDHFLYALLCFMGSFLVLSLVSLYLFIMMLLPSQRGANKYGPAGI